MGFKKMKEFKHGKVTGKMGDNMGSVLGKLNHEVLEKGMYIGFSLMDNLNLHWWVSAGTCLGLYRDGKVIPHDTDVDVEVKLDFNNYDEELFDKIKESFNNNGYEDHRFMMYKGRVMQMAFIRQSVIFDIYFMYDGLHTKKLLNYNDHGMYYIPKGYVKELSEDCMDLPMPKPTNNYLRFRYGEDWETPKEKKVNWDEDCRCLTKY